RTVTLASPVTRIEDTGAAGVCARAGETATAHASVTATRQRMFSRAQPIGHILRVLRAAVHSLGRRSAHAHQARYTTAHGKCGNSCCTRSVRSQLRRSAAGSRAALGDRGVRVRRRRGGRGAVAPALHRQALKPADVTDTTLATE